LRATRFWIRFWRFMARLLSEVCGTGLFSTPALTSEPRPRKGTRLISKPAGRVLSSCPAQSGEGTPLKYLGSRGLAGLPGTTTALYSRFHRPS
jgi:hypothetical protein